MSVLSYLSHPALVAASVGGVTLGVFLLFSPWKTIGVRSSLRNSFLDKQVSALKGRENEQVEQTGSCHVAKGFDGIINRVSETLKHVAISCTNVGRRADYLLDNKWVGLFPIEIFKGGAESVKVLKNFNIKTVTKIQGDNSRESKIAFETRFTSDKFQSKEIVGSWKYDDWAVSDKTLDVVNLDSKQSSEKIYFVHAFRRRR